MQSDVFVCFMQPSTNLHSDKLSLALLNEAGDKVEDELISVCPNGITVKQIEVTNAGALKSIRKFYYICDIATLKNSLEVISEVFLYENSFFLTQKLLKVLEVQLKNCFEQLKKDKYKSITIPCCMNKYTSISGELYVKAFLKAALEFLVDNKKCGYSVRFIVDEKETLLSNVSVNHRILKFILNKFALGNLLNLSYFELDSKILMLYSVHQQSITKVMIILIQKELNQTSHQVEINLFKFD